MAPKKPDTGNLLDRLQKIAISFPSPALILCTDTVRRDRAIDVVVKEAQNKDSLEVKFWHATAMSLSEFLSEISSLPLFSKRTLHIVREIDSAKAADANDLLDALSKNSQNSSPVLFSGSSFPSNSRFLKHFTATDSVVSIPELKGYDLRRWASKELKTAGIKIFPEELLELLISATDESPDSIATLCNHLSLYCEGEEATMEDALLLFGRSREVNEYELLDALTQKNMTRATLILHELLKQGKNPFLLLSLLGRTYNQYLLTKSGMPSPTLRTELGVPPFVFNKITDAGAKFSETKLRSGLEALLKCDSLLKNKSLGHEAILHDLLYSLVP